MKEKTPLKTQPDHEETEIFAHGDEVESQEFFRFSDSVSNQWNLELELELEYRSQ